MFDHVLFATDSSGFVPVYLRGSNRTIFKLNFRYTLTFSPSTFTINLPKARNLPNCIAGSEGLFLANVADVLEGHYSPSISRITPTTEAPGWRGFCCAKDVTGKGVPMLVLVMRHRNESARLWKGLWIVEQPKDHGHAA